MPFASFLFSLLNGTIFLQLDLFEYFLHIISSIVIVPHIPNVISRFFDTDDVEKSKHAPHNDVLSNILSSSKFIPSISPTLFYSQIGLHLKLRHNLRLGARTSFQPRACSHSFEPRASYYSLDLILYWTG
jgi:hypothetical protein